MGETFLGILIGVLIGANLGLIVAGLLFGSKDKGEENVEGRQEDNY